MPTDHDDDSRRAGRVIAVPSTSQPNFTTNPRNMVRMLAVLAVAAGACQLGSSEVAPEQEDPESSATPVPETQPTSTRLPTNTAVPTETEVPPPTATDRPTATPGPVVITDDFSSDLGIWTGCDFCTIDNGVMIMGPFPVSGAYIQHNLYCVPCGKVTNYRMSVDVTFVAGQSDRGYGFLVREVDDYMLTYEITPWQTLDFWKADFNTQEWEWINGVWTGSANPGKVTNNIEVEVTTNANNTTDIRLSVSGRSPLVIFGQPAEPGWMGLTLFGHAMEVAFDNFYFESEESPPAASEPNPEARLDVSDVNIVFLQPT